ncbi:MAG TPA: hypothetical protein VIV61_06325 [Candidatus Ozemobacteraceae bacterium]
MTLAERLAGLRHLDRRWIFLLLALTVALPMIRPIGLRVVPGEAATRFYTAIDTLPAGSRFMISFDYEPGSAPELQPTGVAVLVHGFRRGLKPVLVGNWALGGELADQALRLARGVLRRSADPHDREIEAGLVDGKDFVNLGFKPGGVIHLKNMAKDIFQPYPVDRAGRRAPGLEIFRNADGRGFSMADIGLIVSLTGGNHGIDDYVYTAGEHHRPLAAACTSIAIPRLQTYLQTGQMLGMAGGMPGAAEYERLVGIRGSATAGIDSQSMAHLLILSFILLGNLSWQAGRRLDAASSESGAEGERA